MINTTSISFFEQQCLSELKPLSYSYYDTHEGIDPRIRAQFLARNNHTPKIVDCMLCKAYECVPSPGEDHPKGVVLFWRKDVYSTTALEEHLSLVSFTSLSEVPPLMWVSGSVTIEKDELSVVDLTDTASLNDRNSDAIASAMNRLTEMDKNEANGGGSEKKVLSENVAAAGAKKTDDSSAVGEETNDAANNKNAEKTNDDNNNGGRKQEDLAETFSTMSALTTDACDDSNTHHDGDETIIVHTENCPATVLRSEGTLAEILSVLYDIKSGVASKPVSVGGHTVNLHPFHYPDINLEAPRNDKQRTYVDPKDMPCLFGYDWKNALCTRVQNVVRIFSVCKQQHII